MIGLGTQARGSALLVRHPSQPVFIAADCRTERMSIDHRKTLFSDHH